MIDLVIIIIINLVIAIIIIMSLSIINIIIDLVIINIIVRYQVWSRLEENGQINMKVFLIEICRNIDMNSDTLAITFIIL